MKEIMDEYFQILNDYVKVEPIESEEQKIIRTTVIDARELNIILECFWSTEYEKLLDKIKNYDGLKTICYGNVPENIEKFIKRSALYSDLIVIEDPLGPHILSEVLKINDKKKFGNAFNTAISGPLLRVNKIKDWIDEGIVVLLPHVGLQCGQYRNIVDTLVEEDFKDNNLKNLIIQFFNNTVKEYGEPIEGYWNFDGIDDPKYKKDFLTGEIFAVNDGLITSGILNAILTADQKHYWNLLMYKFEKDQKILGKEALSLAALNKANIKFLDNVTLDFARKIREEGYLSELRSFFREKFEEIRKTPDKTEFYDLVNNYSIEINDQVNMHEREWKKISKEAFEIFGVKGGLALASGTIGGVVTFGVTIPAWIGFLGGVLASSNYTIKDIVNEFLEFRKRRRDLRINSVHLLYELKTA